MRVPNLTSPDSDGTRITLGDALGTTAAMRPSSASDLRIAAMAALTSGDGSEESFPLAAGVTML